MSYKYPPLSKKRWVVLLIPLLMFPLIWFLIGCSDKETVLRFDYSKASPVIYFESRDKVEVGH